jgi:hypothetical protein
MLRRTGESAVASGIYHSNCKCRVEHRVRPGDRFPECPECHRPVTWMFTRSVHEHPTLRPRPPTNA